MNNRRRTGTQIIMGILDALKNERKRKTWLQNESNLNSKTFKKHFDYLIKKRYIAQESNSSTNRNLGYYTLTETGKIYLSKLEDLREFESTQSPTSSIHAKKVVPNLEKLKEKTRKYKLNFDNNSLIIIDNR